MKKKPYFAVLMAAILSCMFFVPAQAKDAHIAELTVTKSAQYAATAGQELLNLDAAQKKLEQFDIRKVF